MRIYPKTYEEAVAAGWRFQGVYPQPDQPEGLHDGFIRQGYEVSDQPFDGEGHRVAEGSYALWLLDVDPVFGHPAL